VSARLGVTRSILRDQLPPDQLSQDQLATRSTLMRSTCHEINSHEINLSRDQLNFFYVLLDKSIMGQTPKVLKCFWTRNNYSITQISIAVTIFCVYLLNKVVGKAHPNIFEVFEVMKKEQASPEMKLEQLELERRDLLRRTNGSQHCLSNLRKL